MSDIDDGWDWDGGGDAPSSSPYAVPVSLDDDRDVAKALAGGYLPANAKRFFCAGLSLLRSFLADAAQREHDVAQLADAIRAFANRPRPDLPSPDLPTQSVVKGFTPTPHDDRQRVWIDPRRILLKEPGLGSFSHDNSDVARAVARSPGRSLPGPSDLVAATAQFARRLAREGGDADGLAEIFGNVKSGDAIDVVGWEMPLGSIFRIESNGNHRVAALGALGVPCVLASVSWQHGPFQTRAAHNDQEEAELAAYRTLLQTFGIATFADPRSACWNFDGISTKWPILIRDAQSAVRSLEAVESLTDSWTGSIGHLRREHFESPTALNQLATDLLMMLHEFSARPVGSSGPRLLRRGLTRSKRRG